jgi:hypothetical protein
MSRQQLSKRIQLIALLGLGEANKRNPFISRSDAMKFLNQSRKGE